MNFQLQLSRGWAARGQRGAASRTASRRPATKGRGRPRTSRDAAVGVLLGRGGGSFNAPLVQAGAYYATVILAALDVNGDGKADLVLPPENLVALLGKGDGTFQPPVISGLPIAAGGGGQIGAGDFTGDGVPDVLLAGGELLPSPFTSRASRS